MLRAVSSASIANLKSTNGHKRATNVSMRTNSIAIALLGVLMLVGCSRSTQAGPDGQTATIALKDGGTFTGTVAKSDTSAITVTSPSGETRTYPMGQVDSVHYAPATPATSGVVGNQVIGNQNVVGAAPAPAPELVRTIPAGARIRVRNSDRIMAGVAETGQTFPGIIIDDVMGDDGGVAIPRQSDATLIVRESRGQGKIKGRSEIAIDLDSVTVGGKKYALETRDIVATGKQGVGKNRRSAKFIGGGAILGTVIGAVAGGPAGAAIGAGAGAGAGLGLQALTRGKTVSIPSESVLNFKLEEAAEIRLMQ